MNQAGTRKWVFTRWSRRARGIAADATVGITLDKEAFIHAESVEATASRAHRNKGHFFESGKKVANGKACKA